jgi:pilus assembly protein Flp/PilA
MRAFAKLMKTLGSDESGASLIEYTVLLGILLIAVIGSIIGVGAWINQKWSALDTALS